MPGSTFSHGYALLIGVGADLPVTVKDATALYTVLIDPERAAYPASQTHLLAEEKATRKDILTAFDTLIKQVAKDPDATVVVYFSGHGGFITHFGKPAGYYLVPNGFDAARRAATSISGAEFTGKIEAIKARKLIVLLDCCHAAGIPLTKSVGESFQKSPLPPELLGKLEVGSGRVIVASSRKEEYSYTGAPYSIFTTCLLEALAGRGTKNKDGYARVLDILTYLFDTVPLRAGSVGSQHPFVNNIRNLDDNFPLCYYAGGSKEVSRHQEDGLPSSANAPDAKDVGHYDVFLSYTDADAAVALDIANRLVDEAHLSVWLDAWVQIPGESYQQSLNRGLEQATSCAVCVSSHTPAGWFQQQIERALDRQAEDSTFRVIPVLLPGAQDSDVGNFLKLRTRVDFRASDSAYAFHLLKSGIKGVPPGRWPPGGDKHGS